MGACGLRCYELNVYILGALYEKDDFIYCIMAI